MLTVSEFKGKPLINIRDYYERDSEVLPGKKGVVLNVDQWKLIKEKIGEIDEALSRITGAPLKK
jgi:Transcriptional Coactivator p15 (PC4)